MKQFFLVVFICTTNILFAQEPLSSMSKEKRDSTLVAITQKLLREKFPKWYRKDVYPIITQSDFKGYFLKWLPGDPRDSIPSHLKPDDLCYTVTLYYAKWFEEKFESQYTVSVIIIDKNQEILDIWLGSNFGYRGSYIKNLETKESLSSMPVDKRDSILVELSQNVIKEKYPEVYRKDIYPVIEQSDFRLKGLEWTDETVKYIPDDMAPEDTYYIVTLYYKKWRKAKLQCPFTAIVYIIEKTRQPYLIRLGSDYHFRDLLKPSETE